MVALAPVLQRILLDRVPCLHSTGSVALGTKQGACSRRVPPFSQRGKKIILVGFIKGLLLWKVLCNLNKQLPVQRHCCVTINYL